MSVLSELKRDYITSDNANITENLMVSDVLTVDAIIIVAQNIDVGGTLDVGEDFTVDTDKFTVDYTNGNTVVTGTLDVDDATTITSTLGVTGASTLASLGVTNAATVGTTLGVTGLATLGSVSVTGAATVGTTLGVTGLSTLGSMSVTGAATVGTTLGVTGTSSLAALVCAVLSNTVHYGVSVLSTTNPIGFSVLGRPNANWGSVVFTGTQTERVTSGDYTGAIRVLTAGTYLLWISGARSDADDTQVWGIHTATDDTGAGAAVQHTTQATANPAGQFAMITVASLAANGIVYPAEVGGAAETVTMVISSTDFSAQFGCLRLGA